MTEEMTRGFGTFQRHAISIINCVTLGIPRSRAETGSSPKTVERRSAVEGLCHREWASRCGCCLLFSFSNHLSTPVKNLSMNGR